MPQLLPGKGRRSLTHAYSKLLQKTVPSLLVLIPIQRHAGVTAKIAKKQEHLRHLQEEGNHDPTKILKEVLDVRQDAIG